MKKKLLTLMCSIALLSANAQSSKFDWAKKTGGASTDWGWSVALDAAGNVYTTGLFFGEVDFDPGAGEYKLTAEGQNAFVSKLDASGNFVWAKKIGGPGEAIGKSITVDARGNVYAAGYFYETVDFDPGANISNLTAKGAEDIFISKLDASGNFVWAKQLGGTLNESAASIVTDAAGNVYTTGIFNGKVDFDPGADSTILTPTGNNAMFISKLDASGNFVWAKNISGTAYVVGSSIALDASGNVYTTGAFQGTVDFDPGAATLSLTSNFVTVYILKLDGSGNLAWVKNIESALGAAGTGIALDQTGNIYTTGSFAGIADFDPGAGIAILSAGTSSASFVSKLTAAGNFAWAKAITGEAGVFGTSLAVDLSGNAYTTGFFSGTADFNPGVASFNITAVGDQDVFVSKLDASGNFVWANGFGGATRDQGNAIAVDAAKNVYTTGFFEGTADFDPGAATFELTAEAFDVFIHKISQSTAGINNNKQIINAEAYPNPTKGLLKITLSAAAENIFIEVYNCLGALVYQQNDVKESNTLDLSNQPDGLYFLKVIADDKTVITQKVIKQ